MPTDPRLLADITQLSATPALPTPNSIDMSVLRVQFCLLWLLLKTVLQVKHDTHPPEACEHLTYSNTEPSPTTQAA